MLKDGIIVDDCVSTAGGEMPYTFTTSDTMNGVAICLQVGSNPTETITQEFVEGELIQIEESSTATDYEPYGYKIPINISQDNPNLYDGTLTTGYYINADGEIAANGAFGYCDYIKVEPSKDYVLSGVTEFSSLAYRSVARYDKDYNFINRELFVETNGKQFYEGTFKTTEETKYVRINILIKSLDKNVDLRLKNDTAEHIIYLNEPLRKVGEVADILDYKNKKVIRNVAKQYLFDMAYYIQNEVVTNGHRAGFFSSAMAMQTGVALAGFSNILPANNGAWSSMNSENIRFGQNNTAFYVYTTNTYESKEDLLNYLGSGDVYLPYVIYILKTPTEEQIEIEEMSTFDAATEIEVDTAVMPSEFRVDYWKQIGLENRYDGIVKSSSNIGQ